MARFYALQFNNVSVSAAQDLFAVRCGANIGIKLHQFELNSESSTAPAELRVIIKRMTATVTLGSGGSTNQTPSPLLSTDAACSITNAGLNNTGRATTSGSTTNLFPFGWNVLNGLLFVPAPEWRPSFAVNEALIIGLETAPGSATTMNAYIVIEELT
jgi:hypothetical protein